MNQILMKLKFFETIIKNHKNQRHQRSIVFENGTLMTLIERIYAD